MNIQGSNYGEYSLEHSPRKRQRTLKCHKDVQYS